MKITTNIAWAIGAIVIIALGIWAFKGTLIPSNPSGNAQQAITTGTSSNSDETISPSLPSEATPAGNTSFLGETYANATHRFTISYPKELNAQNFGVFHELNNNDWRYAATQEKRGTAVVEIPVIEIDNSADTAYKNYPIYYTARVRVAVSGDTTNCYAKDDGYTEQTVTNVTIGGVTFKKFLFSDVAMMKYINGASYRTIRNNKCYVIEQVENGSSYRDERMQGGYSDTDLRSFYNKTTPIVMSFRFQ